MSNQKTLPADHLYDAMSYSNMVDPRRLEQMKLQNYMAQMQHNLDRSLFNLSPSITFSGEEAKLVLNTIKPTPNKLLLLVEDLP